MSRLRPKLQPLPPATTKDRARWKRIAEDDSAVIVTAEAPEVGSRIPGIMECAPPASFTIDDRTAAWFDAHGGARAVMKALRSYMRTHAAGSEKVRRKPSNSR